MTATPIQFSAPGRRFYVGAYKSMKHGVANMDVLVALGTSAAYFYSVLILAMNVFNSSVLKKFSKSFLVLCVSISEVSNLGETGFETAALLITFIIFGKYIETISKGRASEALTKLMSLQVCFRKQFL